MKETVECRSIVQRVLCQRHFMQEKKSSFIKISTKEVLVTFSRERADHQPVGVAFERIIVRHQGDKDPKGYVIIKAEEGETNRDWYEKLFNAIYNVKGYGPKVSNENILAQIRLLFSASDVIMPSPLEDMYKQMNLYTDDTLMSVIVMKVKLDLILGDTEEFTADLEQEVKALKIAL